MAEGFLNTFYKDKYEASSAGTDPTEINPYAVEVMKELGIDISNNRSKSIEEFRNSIFDIVVTVCDNAKETCPFFPGKKIIHESFPDPSMDKTNVEDILTNFRKTRDEIKDWIIRTFK
jgi:arsenate reductase